jgi:hypothetical protein
MSTNRQLLLVIKWDFDRKWDQNQKVQKYRLLHGVTLPGLHNMHLTRLPLFYHRILKTGRSVSDLDLPPIKLFVGGDGGRHHLLVRSRQSLGCHLVYNWPIPGLRDRFTFSMGCLKSQVSLAISTCLSASSGVSPKAEQTSRLGISAIYPPSSSL